MFVIAYILILSGIGSIEPGWLRVLQILAIAEGGVMAVELVYRALNLFAWGRVEPLPTPPHCSYCCDQKRRDERTADLIGGL